MPATTTKKKTRPSRRDVFPHTPHPGHRSRVAAAVEPMPMLDAPPAPDARRSYAALHHRFLREELARVPDDGPGLMLAASRATCASWDLTGFAREHGEAIRREVTDEVAAEHGISRERAAPETSGEQIGRDLEVVEDRPRVPRGEARPGERPRRNGKR